MGKVSFALAVFPMSLGFAPAQVQPTIEPNTTIRTTVQEVVLDLVVRDSKGRIVKNLQPGDVEIYEDGVRQQLKAFRLVSGRDVVEQQAAIGKAKAAQAPNASAFPLKAVNLVCVVFHNMDTDPTRRQFTMGAVRDFLKSQLQPDTWVAVFSLDARLNVLQPFTNDQKLLLAAAAKSFAGGTYELSRLADAVYSANPTYSTISVAMSGTPGPAGVTVSTNLIVHGGELNQQAIAGADVSTDMSANAQRGDAAGQQRAFGGIEGMQARDQMIWLINALAPLPGRKSILMFSTGMTAIGDPDLEQSMIDKANKAHVTFYSVDTNGLSENSTVVAGNEALRHAAAVSATQTAVPTRGDLGSGGEMEKFRGTDYSAHATNRTDTQAGLREIAEGTGGFLIANTNDLHKPYQHLLEDVGTHYEAVYKPASDKLDGRLRSIEVKLARSGLTAESRTGYFAMPALPGAAEVQPSEITALGMLSLPQRPHAFDFRAAVLQFRPGATASQQALAVEVPGSSLLARPLPGLGRNLLHASWVSLVKDASGQVIGKFSQDTPFEVPDDNLAAFKASSFNFEHPLDLPPGHYSVDTSVVDVEGHRASVATTPFDVPSRTGLGISSIVLVQRAENIMGSVDPADPFQFQAQLLQGSRIIPELNATLAPGAKPFVYFVVYPDKSSTEKPKLQVEILVGGKLLARQTADLGPPDATGAVPMVVGTAARPGECELRITAMQGSASAQQSLKYQVRPN